MFPIIQNIKRLISGTRTRGWLLASATAIALAAPGIAQARPNDRNNRDVRPAQRDVVRHDVIERHDVVRDNNNVVRDDARFDRDRHVDAFRDFHPEFRDHQRWIAPVYQTVTATVWVPDQYQDEPVSDGCTTTIQPVLVVPGHFEVQTSQVCVTEGYWAAF